MRIIIFSLKKKIINNENLEGLNFTFFSVFLNISSPSRLQHFQINFVNFLYPSIQNIINCKQ